MAKKKLIIIGIDGGTFDIINPLFDQNKLPNLKKFKYKEILKSTTPPGTAVAWASFSTGNTPGKTNIYDFTLVDKESWKIKFINRKILGSKPLWEYLDQAKLKSCFINIPVTYPPAKINGVMISGIDTPSKLSNFTHPQDLKQKLKKLDYDIEASGLKDKDLVSRQAIDILEARIKATNYLLEQDFDFFIVLFRASDVVQHFSWGKPEVEETYTKIDNFIGDLQKRIKKTGEDIIIMSDHGHEKVNKAFNTNVWLEKNGYLKTKIKNKNILSVLGINRERIFKILERLRLEFLVSLVPRRLGKKIPTKDIDFEEAIITNLIDLKNTKAISKRAVKSSQIFLNTANISKVQEENLKNEIIAKLKKFFKNNNMQAEIKSKEELYNGASNAPDITLYLKEKGYDTLSKFSPNKKIWDDTKEQATHNTEGIILTDLNLNFKDAKITDLSPTILDYFKINYNKKNFDGKSLI